MARNHTIVQEHRAEFKAVPFSRPFWQAGMWEHKETLPYAATTLARDYVKAGWTELDPHTVFPNGTSYGIPVDRVFVWTMSVCGRFGRMVTLTDRRSLRS